MKTIASRLTIATLLVAAAAAAVLSLAPHADAPQEVVVLPRVEVTGQRMLVVQLPTVHVTARRDASQPTLVAQKAVRADAL